MGSLHPRIAASIESLGECIERRVALIGTDDDSGIEELFERIDLEVSSLAAARALWPDDELVLDALTRLSRCHAETRWWNAQGAPGDDDDDLYLPSDAYYDAIQDLFWAAGADAHAAAVVAYRGKPCRCARRADSDRGLTTSALVHEARSLVARLGDAPWERESDADAVRRLAVLGAMFHDAAHEPSLRRESRIAIRRLAGALWSLEHLRISDVRQVWGEVQRACAALGREDERPGQVIDLATRRAP